jgi:hypothetical protein
LRITILAKTRCVLLHFDGSKRCVCPLYKFLYAFKVVKLFLKHPVRLSTYLLKEMMSAYEMGMLLYMCMYVCVCARAHAHVHVWGVAVVLKFPDSLSYFYLSSGTLPMKFVIGAFLIPEYYFDNL